MYTALKITFDFKKLVSDDPVKYDFAQTRLDIKSDMDINDFVDKAE